MSVAADLWSDLLEGEEVAYVGGEPARAPRFAPIPEGLHPKVADALAARGIEQLFTHQADAWDAAQRGEHLVVTTGTASGKTLAFNLPVLDALARQPKTRALYLYPTKALAQDQIRSLTELKPPAIKPAIYDGDTESSRRWQIRKWSNLILTNPDMLHVGVLPHHDRWGDVLHNLRYVVVDEAHVYRGVFGSHVGNVLRRLRRLARIYGADPQFLLASATIANPGELARRLLGVEATTIEQDGAPKAERTILLWNPPLTDEELGLRASALGEAARLMASLVERGVRTLCFAKSRKSAELVHRFTAQRSATPRACPVPRRLHPRTAAGDRAQARRGRPARGQRDERARARDRRRPPRRRRLRRLPGNRREPEAAVGPRRAPGHGLAAMVATEDALDQFFMRDPEALLDRRVEAAILDHANPRVLDGHVRSAAFEAPLDEADTETLGPEALERAAQLPDLPPQGRGSSGPDGTTRQAASASARQHRLLHGRGRLDRVAPRSRRAGAGLLDRPPGRRLPPPGRVVPRARARPGESHRPRRAVHRRRVHPGEEGHDDGDRRAAPRRAPARPRPHLRPRRRHRAGRRLPAEADRRRRDDRDPPARPSARPSSRPRRSGSCPKTQMLDGLTDMPRLLGSLHAAEHAMIAILPLWAMCDRWDIGGLSTNLHFQTGRPTIFVYDGHAGGVGITERGFDVFEGWVADTARCSRAALRPRLPVVRAVAQVREPERAARQGRRAELLRRMLSI